VAGVAVYYSESSKWEFFVYYNPKLPSYFQTFAALSIFYSEQTKRIYLTDLGDSVFYGQYDDIKRKYEFKPEYKILLDMMPYFYDICQLNDGKLIYLGDQDFYMIDPITNKYTKLKYNNSVKEFLASDYDFYYSYRNLKLVNEDNRIIYLQSIIKKNDEDYRYVPYIMDIQIVNDSVINPRKLELPSIYSGEKKSSWFFLTDWVDKDNLKDSLIIGCKKDLFIYNVKNRILSIIPRPEEFKSDTLEYWNHRAGMIDIQKRELWLASPFHGIMIYDLDELIKTSYPVNIEELETLLTIVGIDNIFPIPANETIKIEYFQQIGSEDEIKLEIYNLKGEILPNIDYHISTIEGMRKLITITTNIKEPGTYIANIKLRNYSASDKFIITR